jgi:hypothetical protein
VILAVMSGAPEDTDEVDVDDLIERRKAREWVDEFRVDAEPKPKKSRANHRPEIRVGDGGGRPTSRVRGYGEPGNSGP